MKLPVDRAIFVNTGESDMTDNIYYFLGHKISSGALIMPKRGRPKLFIPGFEYPMWKALIRDVHVVELKSFRNLVKNLTGTLGYDSTEMSAHLYQKIKNRSLKDIHTELRDMRMQKRPDEVCRIRKATEITTKIFKAMLRKRWRHEQDIKRFLLVETAKHDCEPAFDPVVASGKDAADPHYSGAKPLRHGFCVIDYGVRYQGYRADVTRTVYVGKPKGYEKDLYERVRKVQKECIALYRKGGPCKGPHEYARQELGENLIHLTGHGIGLDIHEAPSVGGGGVFRNGMVVTCEPGYYIKGRLGIRIEDDLMIQGRHPLHLTKDIPTELICWP